MSQTELGIVCNKSNTMILKRRQTFLLNFARIQINLLKIYFHEF